MIPAIEVTTTNLLRRFLRRLILTDSSLSEFTLDYFRETHSIFSDGMNRLAKENLLLERETSTNILIALKKYNPTGYLRFAYLLKDNKSPIQQGGANPYRGLNAFQIDDDFCFFGREEMTDMLWLLYRDLHEQDEGIRILAIIGPSGAGKSSVARAGLVSTIIRRQAPCERHVELIDFRPGDRPTAALASALVNAESSNLAEVGRIRELRNELMRADFRGEFDGLRTYISSLPDIKDNYRLLLIDQFEEIYTQCKDQDERDAFVGALLSAAKDPSKNTAIIMTLRSDFLSEAQKQHVNLCCLFENQSVIVTALSIDGLRKAITQPAMQAGILLDDSLVELLINQSKGREGALPLLQFTLTQLWEERSEERSLGEILAKMGGVGGALATKAQEIYNSLSSQEKAITRYAFERLLHVSENNCVSRRRLPVSDLCSQKVSEQEVLQVLRKFALTRIRLVTLGADKQNITVEVAHESIYDNWALLHQWIGEMHEHHQILSQINEAAHYWLDSNRNPGRLWREPDLTVLVNCYRNHRNEFTNLQREFYDDCTKHRRREQIIRTLAISLLVVFLASAITIYSIQQWRVRQQHLSAIVEKGRQDLVDGRVVESALWLQHAYESGSNDPILPTLLHSALLSIDAQQSIWPRSNSSLSGDLSDDGKLLATVNAEGLVQIWDIFQGSVIMQLQRKPREVVRILFSPDSNYLLLIEQDYNAELWNLSKSSSGHSIISIEAKVGEAVKALFCDNHRLILGGKEGVALFSIRAQQIIFHSSQNAITGDEGLLSSCSAYGDILSIVEDKTKVSIYQLSSGSKVATLDVNDEVTSLALDPIGARLAIGTENGSVSIWLPLSGLVVRKETSHEGAVTSLNFSPNSKYFVSAGKDGATIIWNTSLVKPETTLDKIRGEINSAIFSPDGAHVITTGGSALRESQNFVRIWSSPHGVLVDEYLLHSSGVFSARFSRDNKFILSQSWDGTLRLWYANGNRIKLMLQDHSPSAVWETHFNPNGHEIVSAGGDGIAMLWDSSTGRPIHGLSHRSGVRTASFRQDGERILTGCDDHIAREWARDGDKWHQIKQYQGHEGFIFSAMYSADGRKIVTASNDSSARIWDAESGKPLSVIKAGGSLDSAEFSPDGKTIITAGGEDAARIWDAATGLELGELKHSNVLVWIHLACATFSPDGARVVTCGSDHVARIWDVKARRVIAELKGHRNRVSCASFSHDGTRIATGSWDGIVRIWDSQSGRLLSQFDGHASSVDSIIFSGDDASVSATYHNGAIILWNSSLERRSSSEISKTLRCRIPLRLSANIIHLNPLADDCDNRPERYQHKYAYYLNLAPLEMAIYAWKRQDAIEVTREYLKESELATRSSDDPNLLAIHELFHRVLTESTALAEHGSSATGSIEMPGFLKKLGERLELNSYQQLEVAFQLASFAQKMLFSTKAAVSLYDYAIKLQSDLLADKMVALTKNQNNEQGQRLTIEVVGLLQLAASIRQERIVIAIMDGQFDKALSDGEKLFSEIDSWERKVTVACLMGIASLVEHKDQLMKIWIRRLVDSHKHLPATIAGDAIEQSGQMSELRYVLIKRIKGAPEPRLLELLLAIMENANAGQAVSELERLI